MHNKLLNILSILLLFVFVVSILCKIQEYADNHNIKNCRDAYRKGYYNMTKEHKFYRKELDRDNDGIACENRDDRKSYEEAKKRAIYD